MLFVVEAASELRVSFRESKARLKPPPRPSPVPNKHIRSFPTGRSKAVPLLSFFNLCALVIAYVTILSLFIHLSFLRCPGKVALRFDLHRAGARRIYLRLFL